MTATSVSWGAAACSIVRPGSSERLLRERPAGDDRGHRERGGVARRLESPGPDERERGDAGEH